MSGTVSSAILAAVFMLALTACSKSNVASVPEQELAETTAEISADVQATDFSALLTRTDEVEVCTKGVEASTNRTLGPGYYPAGYERLGCECVRDTMLFGLEQVEGSTPALRNAVIQISLNMDVLPYIHNENAHPGGAEAFGKFLAEDASDTLGFNDEDLSALVDQASAEIDRLNGDPWAMMAAVPSCQKVLEEARRLYPGVPDAELERVELNRTALQRLRYDHNIDLNMIDRFLITSEPRSICPQYLEIYPPHAAECYEYWKEIEASSINCTPAQLDIFVRLALSVLYSNQFGATANEGDVLYYVASRAPDLGWSATDLEGIFALFASIEQKAPIVRLPPEAKDFLIDAVSAAEA